jgi:uncharacterized MAPEG superfamily protein
MPATSHLAAELFWLTASALMTGLLWVPYVLNRMVEHGPWAALKNPSTETAPRAEWAKRMLAAHANAVENLVVFAPLVLAAVSAGRTSGITAAAAEVYFFSRLAHFVVYSAGVPLLRTLAFAAGWAACVVIALATFGLLG